MHAHNPDNGGASGLAGRDTRCSREPGRSSTDPHGAPVLKGPERHLSDRKILFRPAGNGLWKTRLPPDSPQTTNETCRQFLNCTLWNFPAPCSAIQSHSPTRSFRFFVHTLFRQRDSFYDNLTVLSDPGPRINKHEGRPVQDELRTGIVRFVQVFSRNDWPETLCHGGSQR